MIRADISFLRNKFARRIFLLFTASVIVPVVIIALLSLEHVSTLLREHSYEQSRQVSKSIGMELIRRLRLARDELLVTERRPDLQEYSAAAATVGVTGESFSNPSAFAYIDGPTTFPNRQTGTRKEPILTHEQKHELEMGKTLLLIQAYDAGRADILMQRALGKDGHADQYIVGKLKSDFLWGVNDMLPPSYQLHILMPSGEVLYSSEVEQLGIIPYIKQQLDTSISGNFAWDADRYAQLASYWSVFTEADFSVSSLIVVATQPEAIALEAISTFKLVYIPLLLLAVLFISLVSANIIRRKMVPLGLLQQATQRISGGDFSCRVDIQTDDEFAELGDSLNAMTSRLGEQFTSLATMAEIDRLILSSFDARFIVSTVLSRVGELTPCAVAAVLEFDVEDPALGNMSVRCNAYEAETVERRVQVMPEQILRLHESPFKLLFTCITECPKYLAEIMPKGVRNVLLFPAFVKQRLSTVMIFGYIDLPMDSEDHCGGLRKFSDHVAIALSNAGWEERLYHQAHYDGLTNLPNRALLKDRLEQAIGRACRNQSTVGVLFLDLDRFKLINDTLGHAAGDTVLNNVADILMSSVRSVDTVVRFGGDEFVIIIPDIDAKDDAVFELGLIAEKVLNAAQFELLVEGQVVQPRMSIGISLYPQDGKTAEELVKNADAAMYHAKDNGRGRYEFFAPEFNVRASRRLKMEQELRRALLDQELFLNYQPKVDCLSGELLGAEALIRWQHPQKGLIPPLEFISIAEEVGLIGEIGEWVLRTVCGQINAWRHAGLDVPPIAVNVSPRQFREIDFVDMLSEIIGSARIEPGMIELEITEGTVMEDAAESIDKLQAIRDMGLRLSIDDFGTGYSSLAYLRRLPIHTLKIDRSFITGLVEEDDAQAIVSATIILAHKLGLHVVAEGVETEAQKILLQAWRCDELQGYLIGRPSRADEFAALYLHEIPARVTDARYRC